MKAITQNPYKIIWTTIPVLLLISFLSSNSTIDIQLHDTYIVLTPFDLAICCGLLLGVIGLLYWLTRNRKKVDWVTAIHCFLSITSSLSIVGTAIYFAHFAALNVENFSLMNRIIIVLFLLLIFSQIVLIINLIISLLRKAN
ncbi:MAG: hypothetical protein P1U56_17145 [Saprospiraceae bacterium]|nr:hypothetical protein [Saprospiraceae bacterium]